MCLERERENQQNNAACWRFYTYTTLTVCFVPSIKNKPYKSEINQTQHALKLKVSEAGHCTEGEVEQKGIMFIPKKNQCESEISKTSLH